MEADLRRHYGIDLADRWSGDLTLRRIGVLVDHLPDDSAIAAIHNDHHPVWHLEHVLLADVWEALASLGGVKRPTHPRLKSEVARHKHARTSPARRIALAQGRERARLRRLVRDRGEIT